MGRRRALIIANSEYDHAGLAQLRSPSADATALAEVLGDRRISDFEVEIVRNETANVVQERVEDLFLEGAPDDVLLLHFSCHGVKSESGELYFAARNTRPHRLGSTAVPADFVRRCMRVSRSRSIVLLLDCCYGGAFSEGVSVRAAGDVHVLDSLSSGRGRAVITASNSMEYAFEGDRLAEEHAGPSVFTSALVRGLSTGEADRDLDGLISLNELYDYVFEQVRADNPNQTPSRDIEMQGELFLARSGRRKITPLPMPADLAAAVADPNMFTRLGAVAELRTRLRSANLEVAAGAFEALTSMSRTDIANVAAAAAEAVRDAEVRPSAEELRFTTGAPQVVSLGGPPLAREVAATASEPWIVVARGEDGWSVSVRHPPAGLAHGRVVFTGPTGEAAVAVIAAGEVIPEPRPETVVAPAPREAVPPAPRREVTPPPAKPAVPTLSVAADAPKPSAPSSGPSSADKGLKSLMQLCTTLAFAAAALLFLTLGTTYYYDDYLAVSRPDTLWFFVPIAVACTVAAVCLAQPGGRAAGLGALIASGSVASWGLGFLFGDLAQTEAIEPFEVAFWAGLTGLLVLLVAAGVGCAVVSRDHDLAFVARARDWRSWLLTACGVAMPVLFVVLAGEQFATASTALAAAETLPLGATLPGVFLAFTAPIAPVLAARARPRTLEVALVITWAVVVGATVAAYLNRTVAPLLWVPLLVAAVTVIAGGAVRRP